MYSYVLKSKLARNERVLLIVLPLFSISKRENYKSFVYDKVAFPSPQMSTFPEFASNFRDFSSPKGVVISRVSVNTLTLLHCEWVNKRHATVALKMSSGDCHRGISDHYR